MLRTNGAVRRFASEPVPDEVLASVLELARFAPSGGNRQGWHVIVVKDPELRLGLRNLYQLGWREYMAYVRDGLVPFAPSSDGQWHGPVVDLCKARKTPAPNAFADALEDVPVMLLVAANLPALAVTDVDLPRVSIVGGASVYPFVENLLLAARCHGLGGVMTTVVCRQEASVKRLLDIPDEWGVAALVALGVPLTNPKRLTRRAIEEFTTIDKFGGPALFGSGPGRDA